MVLITRSDKRKVYLHLLNEGVIVFKKDFSMTKHADTDVPHLFVWMLLRSLKDKDLIHLVFNWGYYYYYIAEKGVPHLREQLGITDDSIVPQTYIDKKKHFGQLDKDDADFKPKRRFGGGGGRGYGRGGRGGGRFGGRNEQEATGEEGGEQAEGTQEQTTEEKAE